MEQTVKFLHKTGGIWCSIERQKERKKFGAVEGGGKKSPARVCKVVSWMMHAWIQRASIAS